MGKEIRLLFWGWLAGDGGGEALTLGEEVETGAGGDREDCRSTQGRLTTSQTPVRISQSMSLHRQSETVGQGGDHGAHKRGDVGSGDQLDLLYNYVIYVIKYGGGLVAKLCPTLAISWTIACQTPLSMGFPRQEYWSWLPGLSSPSPVDLPDPEVKPGSPALHVDS